MKKLLFFNLTLMFSLVLVSCNDVDTSLTTINESSTEELITLNDTYFQYSTHSTQNILITHLELSDDYYITDLDDNRLVSTDIIEFNDYYEIKSDYILNYESDSIEFYLYFDHYKTKVMINRTDNTDPYIISSSLVNTDGDSDLVFQFELFDGSIRQVTGSNFNNDGYIISGNLLTIQSEYIVDEFETRDEIRIDYVLDSNGLVLGFINIKND